MESQEEEQQPTQDQPMGESTFLVSKLQITTILTRFQGHYQDIKTNNDTSVTRHFNKCFTTKNGQPSDFSISVLSFIHQ